MLPAGLQVIADDLSGAAECAAALAHVTRREAPLVLKGAFPACGSWVVDTDSRALSAGQAAALAVGSLRRVAAGRAPGNILFKKIDSTLRGHVAAELRAALSPPGLVDLALVCPALPEQGRTLQEGVLHLREQPLRGADGATLDLMRLLAGVDANAMLVRPREAGHADALARVLLEAVGRGVRVLAADASNEEDLGLIARAAAAVRARVRLLAVGSAGLAKALAAQVLQAGAVLAPAGERPSGPVVAVVGSFSPVTQQQVDALVDEPDVHLARLDAGAWLGEPGRVAEAIALARSRAAQGHDVVFSVCGEAPAASSRELVRRMAAAAEPEIRSASSLVLTGGDTARSVLDLLGVGRLDVAGELEPGICLSRGGTGLPSIVTKAGGFGDRHSLVRVLRRFRPVPVCQAAI